MSLESEWDSSKAEADLKNHGVGFDEALTVFSDPAARILDDPDHSTDEVREIIIGYSQRQRLLLVFSLSGRQGTDHQRAEGDGTRATGL